MSPHLVLPDCTHSTFNTKKNNNGSHLFMYEMLIKSFFICLFVRCTLVTLSRANRGSRYMNIKLGRHEFLARGTIVILIGQRLPKQEGLARCADQIASQQPYPRTIRPALQIDIYSRSWAALYSSSLCTVCFSYRFPCPCSARSPVSQLYGRKVKGAHIDSNALKVT